MVPVVVLGWMSAQVLKAVTGWIARHYHLPGARPAQRAGTVHDRVVLVLSWLRHRLDVRTLAGEAGLSIATAICTRRSTSLPWPDDGVALANAAGDVAG
jgi:hypothetical protein